MFFPLRRKLPGEGERSKHFLTNTWHGRSRWEESLNFQCKEKKKSVNVSFLVFLLFSQCFSFPSIPFLPFPVLCEQLFACYTRWRWWREKKSNKHKSQFSFNSATFEMLFKRDTWSILPFHLDRLTALPSPLLFFSTDNDHAFLPLIFSQFWTEKVNRQKSAWIMQH